MDMNEYWKMRVRVLVYFSFRAATRAWWTNKQINEQTTTYISNNNNKLKLYDIKLNGKRFIVINSDQTQ